MSIYIQIRNNRGYLLKSHSIHCHKTNNPPLPRGISFCFSWLQIKKRGSSLVTRPTPGSSGIAK